jgi:hypothetical protein
VALAVDLFAERNRIVCIARFMGGMLLRPFDNRGIWDLKAALGVLAEQSGVGQYSARCDRLLHG